MKAVTQNMLFSFKFVRRELHRKQKSYPSNNGTRPVLCAAYLHQRMLQRDKSRFGFLNICGQKWDVNFIFNVSTEEEIHRRQTTINSCPRLCLIQNFYYSNITVRHLDKVSLKLAH